MGPGQPGLKVSAEGIQLDHHPDPKKSRAQYLPLLELAVSETPQDDRSVHYLGREYLFHSPVGRLHPHPDTAPGHAQRHLGR